MTDTEERLKAVPGTRLCTGCKSAEELGSNPAKTPKPYMQNMGNTALIKDAYHAGGRATEISKQKELKFYCQSCGYSELLDLEKSSTAQALPFAIPFVYNTRRLSVKKLRCPKCGSKGGLLIEK